MDFVAKLVPPIWDMQSPKIKVPWPNETVVGQCKAGKLADFQKKCWLSSMTDHNQQPAGPISPTWCFKDEKTGHIYWCILAC